MSVPESNNKSHKYRPLTIAGIAFLLVHFTMTIGYTVHGLNVEGAAKTAVQSYMTPMFHQGWQLFAPDVPGYQHDFTYRAHKDGSWSEWVDATQMEKMDHRKIPYAAQKVAKQLANQLEGRLYYVGEDAKLDKVKRTGAYYRAVYYCSMHWKHETGSLPDSVQIALDYIITPDFNSGQQEVDDMHFEFETDGL